MHWSWVLEKRSAVRRGKGNRIGRQGSQRVPRALREVPGSREALGEWPGGAELSWVAEPGSDTGPDRSLMYPGNMGTFPCGDARRERDVPEKGASEVLANSEIQPKCGPASSRIQNSAPGSLLKSGYRLASQVALLISRIQGHSWMTILSSWTHLFWWLQILFRNKNAWCLLLLCGT